MPCGRLPHLRDGLVCERGHRVEAGTGPEEFWGRIATEPSFVATFPGRSGLLDRAGSDLGLVD
jgi:hypothetical protein